MLFFHRHCVRWKKEPYKCVRGTWNSNWICRKAELGIQLFLRFIDYSREENEITAIVTLFCFPCKWPTFRKAILNANAVWHCLTVPHIVRRLPHCMRASRNEKDWEDNFYNRIHLETPCNQRYAIWKRFLKQILKPNACWVHLHHVEINDRLW